MQHRLRTLWRSVGNKIPKWLNIKSTQKIYELGMRSKKGHMINAGFQIIAPVATIAAVVAKRVSATVAIYGNILFSDSSDKYDSGDERR